MPEVYSHPLFYDILFGWDRLPEAQFYDAAFRAHGVAPGGRVLEVGCGTGQVAVRLAKLGWRVIGLDNEPEMLAFLEDAAAAERVAVGTILADMTDFAPDAPFHGAYCPMGTVGHLPHDEAVVRHLQATGAALEPGGIYLIDTELVDCDTAYWDYEDDEWEQTRGPLTVGIREGTLYAENSETGEVVELPWDAPLRCFNIDHFLELIEQSGLFAVEAWYPEADRTDEGISLFSLVTREETPVADRTMAVLRRID